MAIDLEKERLNRGCSLTGMAAEIGVARNTLKSAEQGKGIHPSSALKIANFFDVQVTDIIRSDGADAEAAAA